MPFSCRRRTNRLLYPLCIQQRAVAGPCRSLEILQGTCSNKWSHCYCPAVQSSFLVTVFRSTLWVVYMYMTLCKERTGKYMRQPALVSTNYPNGQRLIGSGCTHTGSPIHYMYIVRNLKVAQIWQSAQQFENVYTKCVVQFTKCANL